MTRTLPALALTLAIGCADGGPYCGLPADATGRLVAYCGNPRQEPVCDMPGMEAHFEGPITVARDLQRIAVTKRGT